MSRIVCVSPYKDISLLVQTTAEEIGMDIEVYEAIIGDSGWLGDSQNVKTRFDEGGIDVVISRGGTALQLARSYDYPIVTITSGPLDLIECCKKARSISNNLVITTAVPLLGINLLEDVLGVTITEIVIEEVAELEVQIANLAQDGDYCIIGGGLSITYAKKYGVPYVFLHTSRDTVCDALLRAKELAKLRHDVNRRASRLQAILECTNEGIVAIDDRGIIDIFNGAAEKIMGIKSMDALGKSVTDVIPNTQLNEVLIDRQVQINEIQNIGNTSIVASRVPIVERERVVGAVATFQEASNITKTEYKIREVERNRRFYAKHTLSDILGGSQIINMKKNMAQRFALSDMTVFIYGPSGTGKELFAQGIHRASKRAKGPFVAVNCGALPEALLESELFGYAEGAFTGAKRKGKPGLFELAHEGTIFLDEVDAMQVDVQRRLLRVLQEREIFRIGGDRVIPVDIRVIAATNKLPQDLLDEGAIREDLFYRLNVLRLDLPPLTNRKEDIPFLCKEFVPEDKRLETLPILENVMPYIMNYSWPGNIRELYNFIRRLTFFSDFYDSSASMNEFLLNVAPEIFNLMHDGDDNGNLKQHMRNLEEHKIIEAIKNTNTLVEAASQLGIGKTTLWRKMKNIKELNQ